MWIASSPSRDPQVVRLLIADDHPIFREGLQRLLSAQPDFEVVGQASGGVEAVRLTKELRPDVLLLDIAMPGLNGLEALDDLAVSAPKSRIILLTAAIDRGQIVDALRLGAHGVVMKESASDLLFKSIRCVMAGQYWVGRESVSDLVPYLRRQGTPAHSAGRTTKFSLTPRELQVVSAVVSGFTNKDIAKRFSLSEDTVKHHLSNIFDKVGVSNRLELALFAIHHGLLDQQ